MEKNKVKSFKRARIKRRVRAKIRGTAERPRLSVFKSGRHVYAQLIDDDTATTLCDYSSLKASASEDIKEKRGVEKAQTVGKMLAEVALEKGIEKVVFDRNGYRYHGRVRALAEGAREGGLKF